MKVVRAGTRVGAGACGTTSGSGNISSRFDVTPLTSDQPGEAPNIDPQLKDVWGVTSLQDQFWAVAQATGQVIGLQPGGEPTVHIPLARESVRPGAPGGAPDTTGTGIAVVSESDQILMDIGGNCAAASMIVGAQSGKIWAVNPNISQSTAFVLADRSNVGAQFTGVAVIRLPAATTNPPTATATGGGSCGGGGTQPPLPTLQTQVLAVDFHNERVDIFDVVDGALRRITPTGRQFVIPNLPTNFAPFGILATEDRVVLTAAQRQGPTTGEPNIDMQTPGDGLGVVAAFDLTGNLLWRTESNLFNIPWGMAMGDLRLCATSALLVAQHGNPTEIDGPNNQFGGAIIAMDIRTGKVIQPLLASDMQPVRVQGLWGLTFTTGLTTLNETRLHMGAGPVTPENRGMREAEHGLFARLDTTTR
ncbi:MAG TPA: TIGR03118 family protein [Kofleriaceae bacterium]